MSDLVFTKDDATPTPPTGTASIYAKTDGLFYTKDAAGTENPLKGDQGIKGDPGEGVAPGGTLDQLLVKASGTDYDTEWKSIQGTTNQVSVTSGAGVLTLATPQNLHATANPTFGTVSANLVGTVTGNVAGNVTGNLTGDVSGNVTGSVTGNVTGNVSGTAATFTGSLTGDITSTGMATAIAAGVIVNADINASAAIDDTKLATIATAGKVSNSATTATSANTNSAIVARDGSGNFSAGTITAAVTGNVTGSASLNLLKAGDTMTGALTMTQITKPASPAAGKNAIYPKSDGKFYTLNESGIEQQVGSGAGGGGINYITNSDAEGNAITGYAAYTDAAAASPADGTGGSPNITFAASSTSPLRGTYSFLLTKDAANRQGQGVGYAFTIDAADQAKVLAIEFDYAVASGTYADGDVTVWIYDVTNGTLTQPAPTKILNASGNIKWSGTFQTASNSTSYRIIWHVASTSAAAYSLKFDNIKVGPQSVTYGAPVTDQTLYSSPTVAGFTVGAGAIYWSRIGDKMRVQGTVQANSPTASLLSIRLPNGAVTDSAKAFLTNNRTSVGRWTAIKLDAGLANISSTDRHGEMFVGAGDPQNIYLSYQVGLDQLWGAAGNAVFANGQYFTFEFTVPILGWSSSTVMSSEADTRVVAAGYTGSAATTLNHGTVYFLDFPTKSFDTHGAVLGAGSGHVTVSGTGWRYICQTPGYYRVSPNFTFNGGTYSTTSQFLGQLNLNGTLVRAFSGVYGTGGTAQYPRVSGSATVYCNTGDRLEIGGAQTSGGGVTIINTLESSVSIEKLSGPAQIAASETVAARYYGATASLSSSLSLVTYSTKDFDTHGSYSAGVFNCRSSGRYQVNAGLIVGGTYALNGNAILAVFVGATQKGTAIAIPGGNNTNMAPLVSDTVYCQEGDTISIKASSSATSPVVTASNAYNYLSITRVGNY